MQTSVMSRYRASETRAPLPPPANDSCTIHTSIHARIIYVYIAAQVGRKLVKPFIEPPRPSSKPPGLGDSALWSPSGTSDPASDERGGGYRMGVINMIHRWEKSSLSYDSMLVGLCCDQMTSHPLRRRPRWIDRSTIRPALASHSLPFPSS